jgi:hypothetical protein
MPITGRVSFVLQDDMSTVFVLEDATSDVGYVATGHATAGLSTGHAMFSSSSGPCFGNPSTASQRMARDSLEYDSLEYGRQYVYHDVFGNPTCYNSTGLSFMGQSGCSYIMNASTLASTYSVAHPSGCSVFSFPTSSDHGSASNWLQIWVVTAVPRHDAMAEDEVVSATYMLPTTDLDKQVRAASVHSTCCHALCCAVQSGAICCSIPQSSTTKHGCILGETVAFLR